MAKILQEIHRPNGYLGKSVLEVNLPSCQLVLEHCLHQQSCKSGITIKCLYPQVTVAVLILFQLIYVSNLILIYLL